MDTLAATELDYQTGFANAFESEAIPGALPMGRNSPQKVPFGLYAEQLSGTAFTASQGYNQRSWLYRIRPSVGPGPEFADRRWIAALGASPRGGLPARSDALGPAADLPEEDSRLRRWARDARRGGRSCGTDGHGGACLLRQPVDAGAGSSATPTARC